MIILVAGLPGTGKSYFAERLAKQLGAEYINSDRTRLALHASGRYSHHDKLVVYREMLTEAIKQVGKKRDIVVDATFYHHTVREMFLRFSQVYSLPFYVIEVTADEDIVKKPLRRPREYSEADFAVYEKVKNDFEEIVFPHLTLRSTDSNIDEMLAATIHYLEHADLRRS